MEDNALFCNVALPGEVTSFDNVWFCISRTWKTWLSLPNGHGILIVTQCYELGHTNSDVGYNRTWSVLAGKEKCTFH